MFLHASRLLFNDLQQTAATSTEVNREKSYISPFFFLLFYFFEKYLFTNLLTRLIFKLPYFVYIVVTNFMGGGGSSGSGGAPPTNLGGLGGASSPGSSPTKPSHSHSAQASPTNTLRPWRPRARSADESSKKVF